MEKEAAVKKVFESVYLPTFIEKCASHGVKFNNDEDLQSALTTVAMLKEANLNNAETEQPATSNVSLFKQAALDLARNLEQSTARDSELEDALSSL